MRRWRLIEMTLCCVGSLLLAFLSGCNHNHSASGKATRTPESKSAQTPLFVDVATQTGVRFTHTNGATGNYYFIETTPAGCAFFDYDNDGFLDILLIQSGSSDPPNVRPNAPNPGRPSSALYHNNGDGTFTEVTVGSGLDRDLGYAQGVAVGDYDNDGFDDLFFTAYGGNHLLHNETRSKATATPDTRHPTPLFRDVTAQMGLDRIHNTGYATSAAFGDYDNDGKLDLYVCYYCPWTWETDARCQDAEQRREYCSPEVYKEATHQLFHNEGTRFVDMSEKAGITKTKGHGLAVAFTDYNDDGKQDIFVANDLNPNMLWRNNGNGTFTNVALEAGCAYAEGGALMAGMGIALADYDHSGHDSLFVTNFSGKPNALFKNMGNGNFHDMGAPSGLLIPHMPFLAFGCEFLDYDNDGWSDLFVTNGHVSSHLEGSSDGVTYKERKQLFHNEANGTFHEITDPDQMGGLGEPMVGRGLAVGDYDNDGRVDALANNQNGPAQLFHNEDRSSRHWVTFKMIGTKSNRDGMHAKVTLTTAGVKQTATVLAGSSYLSHSDHRVHFGLGSASRIGRVEIRWPSGQRDTLKEVAGDRLYIVTEGKGITGAQRRAVGQR